MRLSRRLIDQAAFAVYRRLLEAAWCQVPPDQSTSNLQESGGSAWFPWLFCRFLYLRNIKDQIIRAIKHGEVASILCLGAPGTGKTATVAAAIDEVSFLLAVNETLIRCTLTSKKNQYGPSDIVHSGQLSPSQAQSVTKSKKLKVVQLDGLRDVWGFCIGSVYIDIQFIWIDWIWIRLNFPFSVLCLLAIA